MMRTPTLKILSSDRQLFYKNRSRLLKMTEVDCQDKIKRATLSYMKVSRSPFLKGIKLKKIFNKIALKMAKNLKLRKN